MRHATLDPSRCLFVLRGCLDWDRGRTRLRQQSRRPDTLRAHVPSAQSSLLLSVVDPGASRILIGCDIRVHRSRHEVQSHII